MSETRNYKCDLCGTTAEFIDPRYPELPNSWRLVTISIKGGRYMRTGTVMREFHVCGSCLGGTVVDGKVRFNLRHTLTTFLRRMRS